MTLLVKNARLYTGEIVHIFIKNALIYEIGKRKRTADAALDADGRLTLPGIIDPHVHFRSPGEEYKEDWTSGSKAAVAGGVTTVLDMPNNRPPIVTKETLEAKRRRVAGKSYVNYGFYIGATENNFDEIMRARAAMGVKIYLGSSTGGLLLQDYAIVEKILERAPCITVIHSEDEQCLRQVQPRKLSGQSYGAIAEIHNTMRPEKCAVESARRLIGIAEKIKKPIYICHVSGKEELAVFLSAKQKGLPIYLEAAPHHLFLDIKSAGSLGNFARVNPPIRSVSSKKALQKALKDGFIDTIGSDHAPHTKEEKILPYQNAPSGMPGVETMLPLMLDFAKTRKFTMQGLVRCMTENPASIFNIQKRGTLAPGFFGDIVIVEENLTRIVETNRMYSKCAWSAFAGRSLTGFPYATIVNGEIAFLNGRVAENPAGRDIAA